MRYLLGSWLIAWLFWAGLAFGALANRLLQGLTGGAWAEAVRRPTEAAALTLPLVLVLFVPVAIGCGLLYPWGDRALFAGHDWMHKAEYLTVADFDVRSAGTLVICGVLAGLVVRGGRRQTGLCAGGLIAFFLCMNFAATDWVMSLTPRYSSSIFPVIVMSANFLAALAFVVLVSCLTRRDLTEKQCNDLGNLLLAFIVFWAYVSISELILVWSGNLPREISWYLQRWSGGWGWFGLALFLGQFVVPFALLLSKRAKRESRSLAVIAGIVLGASVLEIYWLVMPSISPQAIALPWEAPLIFVLVGAIWLTGFRWILLRMKGREPSDA
ncbi:MAG TPA: hypothetical protein VIM48_02265 [Chthoniobacterales bacterium]